jgi:hypothetical protein
MSIPRITWDNFPGNKYNRTLHIAMLCKQGYVKNVRLPAIGVNKNLIKEAYEEKLETIELTQLPIK